MKKNVYFNFIMFALMSTMLMHAIEPKKSYIRIAQEKVQQQFNTSLDRIQRCFKGNCTKTEALKAARDLSLAALALITISYKIGRSLERFSTRRSFTDPYQKKARAVAASISSYMQKPGQMLLETPSKVHRAIYPLQTDDVVEVQIDSTPVQYKVVFTPGFNAKTVKLYHQGAKGTIEVPISKVKFIAPAMQLKVMRENM